MARLVRQAKTGNRAAFDRLIEHFEPRVYRIVVSRLGNAADALVDLRDPRFADQRTAFSWLMLPRRA